MSTDKRLEEDDQLSKGYSAGNYCNAYTTEDFEEAKEELEGETKAYQAAFILGFFGSYELHEISSLHSDEHREAYFSEHGKRCRELGYEEVRDFSKEEDFCGEQD